MFVACVRCTHGTARARTYEAASRVWLICDRGFVLRWLPNCLVQPQCVQVMTRLQQHHPHAQRWRT